MLRVFSFLLTILLSQVSLAANGQYMTTTEFLEKNLAIQKNSPEATPDILWLTKESKKTIEHILGHPFNALRLRYWTSGNKTAWIFNETGKEKPITIGISIEHLPSKQNKITSVDILEFRESRGWEIRHEFFTKQFAGLFLTEENRLNRRIDGITGATLSVNAVKRCSAMALFIASQLNINTEHNEP